MSNTAVPTWELHHRLARALEWGQVSAEEMADALGVHVNSIYNYASGRRIPKRGFVRQWALRCGVPSDWLEYGDFDDGGGGDSPVIHPATDRYLVSATPSRVHGLRAA